MKPLLKSTNTIVETEKIGEKMPLEEKVYLGIKKAISSHILRPNTQLQEQELSKIFQTSRTPVRAALRRLEYEGLVNIVPRKGAFVVSHSKEDISKVFFLRKHLECIAIELACCKITQEGIVYLKEILLEEIGYYKKKDREYVIRCTAKFHQTISEFCDNHILIRYINELISQTNVYLTFYDPFDADPPHSIGEHQRIIQGLESGNPELACKAMVDHIESLENNLKLDWHDFGIEAWKKALQSEQ